MANDFFNYTSYTVTTDISPSWDGPGTGTYTVTYPVLKNTVYWVEDKGDDDQKGGMMAEPTLVEPALNPGQKVIWVGNSGHYKSGEILTVHKVGEEDGSWFVWFTLEKCKNSFHRAQGACGRFFPGRVRLWRGEAPKGWDKV